MNVEWPGSVHDARVLSNSEVFNRGETGTLVPLSVQILAGVPVPVAMLGDPAYPLLPWLLKHYLREGKAKIDNSDNTMIKECQMIVRSGK